MKKNSRKWNRRHEFQWHKATKSRKGHPSYITESSGKFYRFFCFTHSPTTDGQKNVKLKHNIDPKENRDCYVRPIRQTDLSENFELPYIRYRLHQDDLSKIKNLVSSNKKRKRR